MVPGNSIGQRHLETREGENTYIPSLLFMSSYESSGTSQLPQRQKPALYHGLTHSQARFPQAELVFQAHPQRFILPTSRTDQCLLLTRKNQPCSLGQSCCCPAQQHFWALKKDVSPGSLQMYKKKMVYKDKKQISRQLSGICGIC